MPKRGSRSKRRFEPDELCEDLAAAIDAIDEPPVPSEAEQRAELARCAADPVYWINTYCWTQDPREDETDIKVTLFPQQAEFIRWLWEREQGKEGGVAEKCRDVGFTWCCCWYAVHRWLFRRGAKVGFGSRKLDLVDDSDNPDCIFDKLRFVVRKLPGWMKPRGYDPRRDEKLCKLINRANGARIIGEGGDEIGRGGRTTVYFVDEAAFLERADKVVKALSQNSKVVIWVSTPNGVGNMFEQMRHGGVFAVFTFRWKQDPRKAGWELVAASGRVRLTGVGEGPPIVPHGCVLRWPWYDRELEKWGPVFVAQEIDIDYSASLEGITIPAKWVLAAVNLPIPRAGEKRAGLDVSGSGKNETVLIVAEGPVVTDVLDSTIENTTVKAHWALEECERLGVVVLAYDPVGVGDTMKSTFDLVERDEHPLNFTTHGILGGVPPSDLVWSNGRTSKEWLLNTRAECWWLLRRRFEKAFEYRLWLEGKEGGVEHPLDELISIPNHPKLVPQLSYPLHTRTESGKIKIESKDDMKKRGVQSPDYADALCYLYAPGAVNWRLAAAATAKSAQNASSVAPEVW